MKRMIFTFVFSTLFVCGTFLMLSAQTGSYTPPESDLVKIQFVSNESTGTAWILKPQPDWAKYIESQGKTEANAPEPEWKKFMPKDPVCETVQPKNGDGEQIDVWTVEGWTPVEFDFTAQNGEFPVTTKFTVFPNNKEVTLESNASVGSLWTIKSSDGVTPVEKPVADKKKKFQKDDMIVGEPQVATWSLSEMTKPIATVDFVFNFRGEEMSTVTLTIVKKFPENETTNSK